MRQFRSLVAILPALLLLFLAFSAGASWDEKDFNKRVDAFANNLIDGKKIDTVKEKTDILNDLLTTEYEKIFTNKFRYVSFGTDNYKRQLSDKAMLAKDEGEFAKWKTARAELVDLSKKADLVKESFEKAQKIELNTGKRPEMKLGFEITTAQWKPEEKSKESETMLKELPKAENLLKEALAAIEKGNKDKFAQLWMEDKKIEFEKDKLEQKQEPDKKGSSQISRIFNKFSKYYKEGAKWEVNPAYKWSDLESSAKLFNKEQVIRAHLIGKKGDKLLSDSVYVKKEKGKFIIKSW